MKIKKIKRFLTVFCAAWHKGAVIFWGEIVENTVCSVEVISSDGREKVIGQKCLVLRKF